MSWALSAAAERSTTTPASSASAASGIADAAATRAALERNCRRCMGDSRVGEIAEFILLPRLLQPFIGRPFPPCGPSETQERFAGGGPIARRKMGVLRTPYGAGCKGIERSEMSLNVRHVTLGAPQPCGI